jgi:hypothetical protein
LHEFAKENSEFAKENSDALTQIDWNIRLS